MSWSASWCCTFAIGRANPSNWSEQLLLAATSQVTHVRVDPRSPQYRQRELDQAMQYIQKALHGGQDVIFHCMKSFHRAPVAAAAVYRRVTGGGATPPFGTLGGRPRPRPPPLPPAPPLPRPPVPPLPPAAVAPGLKPPSGGMMPGGSVPLACSLLMVFSPISSSPLRC